MSLSRKRLLHHSRRGAGVVAALAALIGAATVVAGAGIYVGKAVDRQWFWRDGQYAKLQSLRAGFTFGAFERELGAPIFARTSANGRYHEATFRGRDYWVQTLSDQDETVIEYAVTSCDQSFNPTLLLPGVGGHVTLRQSRFADVDSGDAYPLDYSVSGTAAGTDHLYDFALGGAGSYYKQFAWGLNDICRDWFIQLDSYLKRGLLKLPASGGSLDTNGAWIKRFRRAAVVNTYAETAPNVQFRDLRRIVLGHGILEQRFEVGADRLLVSTTVPSHAPFPRPRTGLR